MIAVDACRRIAQALNHGDATVAQRHAIGDACLVTAGWDDLPSWIKDFVVVTESNVVKHYQGQHDQKTHGTWAAGVSKDYAAKFLAAKETGQKIGLTKETLKEIRHDNVETGNMNAYGMSSNGETIMVHAMELRSARLAETEKLFAAMHPELRENLTNNMDELRSEGTVMIAIHSDDALKVLQEEFFRSQFDTGTSNGMVNHDIRAAEETSVHDIHPEINPRLRPIYGYVALENLTPFNVSNYGDIRFELNDSVKQRTTMTDGDSLASRATPVPMVGKPLTQREAVSASMGWGGELHNFGGDDVYEHMDDVSYSDSGYVEAQILGGVNLRNGDVKKIHIRKGMYDESVEGRTENALVALAKEWRIEVEFYES